MLSGRHAAHVREVLHAGPGDSVRIGVVNGPAGTGVVTCDNGAAGILLQCSLDEPALPPSGVSLLLAMPRPKILNRLWPVLGAIGLKHVIIVNAAKVERCYFDTHFLDQAVYRRLLSEGLEQSGDTVLPRVHICRRLKPFIEDDLNNLFPEGTRVVAHPGPGPRMREVVPAGQDALLAAVGPEGGWTGYELEMLAGHGFARISLGPRILRTDTAVTAVVSLAHDMLCRCK